MIQESLVRRGLIGHANLIETFCCTVSHIDLSALSKCDEEPGF